MRRSERLEKQQEVNVYVYFHLELRLELAPGAKTPMDSLTMKARTA